MHNQSNAGLSSRSKTLILAAGLLTVLLPITSMAQPAGDEAAAATTDAANGPSMPSLWDLAVQGGWFMIPIGIASIVTIAFTFERVVGLRSSRILPTELVRKLRELMSESTLDPRRLWEVSDEHPSPLANLVKSAVLKAGRPHSEVEKSVEDAVQRETGEMTRNLRPINVVASIAPLLGLLGTVQGMILAFMVTSTTSSTGTAKAQELAHGIYTALVTTFAGLTVAVISVVLANFLEGRIERLLTQMEGIFLDLLPQLERYEGRLRISESTDEGIKVRQANGAGEKSIVTKNESGKSGAQKMSAARGTQPPRAKDKRPETKVGAATPEEKSVAAAHVSSTAGKTLRSHFDG